jgi:hypothetical protein
MVNYPEHNPYNGRPINNMLENIRISESRNGVVPAISPDNARQEDIILTDRMLMGDNGMENLRLENRRIADERDAEGRGGRRKTHRRKTHRRKTYKRKTYNRKTYKRKHLRRRR